MMYTIKVGEKNIKRKAGDAIEAIGKICNQYHWSYKLNLIDADTCGKECAECLIDRDGGINYYERIVAVVE